MAKCRSITPASIPNEFFVLPRLYCSIWSGLPSTLQPLYSHKKKNPRKRAFLKTLSRMEQSENETFLCLSGRITFCIGNFSNTMTSFCHVIYLPKYFNMGDNMIFAVLLTINIFFNHLLRVVRQRTRNNLTRALMASDTDTMRTIPHWKIRFWARSGITSVWIKHGRTTLEKTKYIL